MEDYAELMGEWLNEKVVKTPYYNWIYQIVCFLMFRWKRKLTYKDLFLLLYGVNRNKVGDRQAKEISLYNIITNKYSHLFILTLSFLHNN